jgi:phosphoribosyl 1,2-cyclic phosphodiesterase
MAMRIKFWGVRGSIPTPSSADLVTSRYGGNTTCVSVRAGAPDESTPGVLIVFDAGSGLRNLGLQLAQGRKPVEATFLFSHAHWDHLQGFPFFVPGYEPGNAFTIYGPSVLRKYAGMRGQRSKSVIEYALRQQQGDLNFPVKLADLPARLTFADLDEGQAVTLEGPRGKLVITPHSLFHPGGCFGYRVEEHRRDGVKTFAYATDTEPRQPQDPSIQRLAKGADALFYDAQYTDEEYDGRDGPARAGWGHSTWRQGVREAQAAGVAHLLLTHHDPLHDDWAVARIENAARREGAKTGLRVTAAYEGMELEF